MAASGDVTIPEDGAAAKLHPYLVAFVRWCVSCFWSTTTVLLHRLLTSSLPPIVAVVSQAKAPSRPAGREHLHPEPRVECAVLHRPAAHEFDVVFVHGLYGSLCNTWRQGEWRLKYPRTPEKVHLRRPSETPTPCSCPECCNDNRNDINSVRNDNKNNFNDIYESRFNKDCILQEYSDDRSTNDKGIRNNNCHNVFNNEPNNDINAFTNIEENIYSNFTKILSRDDVFITEKFYNNTLMGQVEIIDNYETQAQFVSDLFKNCDKNCDSERRHNLKDYSENKNKNNNDGNINNNDYYCCKCTENCEVGCGCVCEECYSPCWPRDWLQVDFPGARVISVNYTSDPHLWRPLWVKETKRLCLHERAEQMAQQLLELGVGQKPIVWVGHSKGGLFIKQIYCEAYEAYLKLHPEENEIECETTDKHISITTGNTDNNDGNMNNNDGNINNNGGNMNNNDGNMNNNTESRNDAEENNIAKNKRVDSHLMDGQQKSSNVEEDSESFRRRAALWLSSKGFMFYSVPHRGSSLADFKTPLTARSVELIEISKDNALVLSLHARWLRASALPSPLVRSVVETRRTLMSVLWLRIVSADSADPGVGALCGISVDHREICKPSSRHCLLYTELTNLISVALSRSKSK